MYLKGILALSAVFFNSFFNYFKVDSYNYVMSNLQYIIKSTENEVLDILDFDVDTSGKIFVLDRNGHRVIVYSSSGAKLYEFGRKGQGPQEFLQPAVLCFHDDKLFVADHTKRRITIFTPKGEYLNSFRYHEQFGIVLRLDCFSYRLFIATQRVFGDAKNLVWELNYWTSDSDGKNMKQIFCEPTYEFFKPMSYTEPGLPPAFGKATNANIFIVDNSIKMPYRMLVYSIFGEKIKEIEKPYEAPEIPSAMKNYIEEYITNFRKPTSDMMGQEIKLEILFPEKLPAIKDIAIDGNKLLVRTWKHWWKGVKEKKDIAEAQYEIEVYSSAGEYLGKGITNLDFENVLFTEDYVYELTRILPDYEPAVKVYKREHRN